MNHLRTRIRRVIGSSIVITVIIVGYGVSAQIRHRQNPQDKITPTFGQIALGVREVVGVNHDGQRLLFVDTAASLRRLAAGLSLSFALSLALGISIAQFALLELLLLRPLLIFGKIPPLALLPIIFIFSGLGDSTKITLIVLGVAPTMTLDIYLRAKQIPKKQFVKALTLGATSWTTARHIVLPQILPAALTALRLQLLNAWLFLIASEAIAASAGLGYRMFLVRRYLAMNIILPYVVWIALLSLSIDASVAWWIRSRYRWYQQ